MAMKFLILAQRWDSSAAAVAAELRRRHTPSAVDLVTSDELLHGATWSHQIDSHGGCSEVQLADGRVLRSEDTGVVLQRLQPFDLPQFGAQDRTYAVAEMSALLLSWLAALPCPVINPATPRSFCIGQSPVRWLALASQAGLPLPRLRLTSNLRRFPAYGLTAADGSVAQQWLPYAGRSAAFLAAPRGLCTHSILLTGDACWGPLPDALKPACRALAQRAGTPLLRLNFNAHADRAGWTFASAEPMPILTANEVLPVAQLMERAGERARSERAAPITAAAAAAAVA
jgi:hypothetical protein